jgi:tetratricopeptide (TPR) repeat protein
MQRRALYACCGVLVVGATLKAVHGAEDESQKSNATNQHALSPDDIAFGETQVEAMVHDRPKMAEIVKKSGAVWTWAVHHFAGEGSGVRTDWKVNSEQKQPLKESNGSALPAQQNHRWLTVSDTGDGEREWESAILVLLGAAYYDAKKDLNEQVGSGKLSESEYCRKRSMSEFECRKQLAVFYRDVWCPDLGVKSTKDKKYWGTTVATYDEWVTDQPKKLASLEAKYKLDYKRARALKLNNDGVRALKALDYATAVVDLEDALRLDANYKLAKQNLAVVFNNYALSLKKEPIEALKKFHKAAMLDPHNSTTMQNIKGMIKRLGKDPNSFDVRAELGREADKVSDFAGAAFEYTEALKIRDDPTIRKRLADLYSSHSDDFELNLCRASGPQVDVEEDPEPASK